MTCRTWIDLPHFVKEQLHALGGDVGQDERVEFAAEHIDCGLGVGVLVRQQGLARRAQGFGRPAAAHAAAASESRLVLEHQPDWAWSG